MKFHKHAVKNKLTEQLEEQSHITVEEFYLIFFYITSDGFRSGPVQPFCRFAAVLGITVIAKQEDIVPEILCFLLGFFPRCSFAKVISNQ